MSFVEWSKSSVDYGRKLVDSAVEGARTGEDEFLKEESLASSSRRVCPAGISAGLHRRVSGGGGWLPGNRAAPLHDQGSSVWFVLGGAIGFSAGVLWENRQLTASVASGAWKNISKTRDEHWFEKNPIDYA